MGGWVGGWAGGWVGQTHTGAHGEAVTCMVKRVILQRYCFLVNSPPLPSPPTHPPGHGQPPSLAVLRKGAQHLLHHLQLPRHLALVALGGGEGGHIQGGKSR